MLFPPQLDPNSRYFPPELPAGLRSSPLPPSAQFLGEDSSAMQRFPNGAAAPPEKAPCFHRGPSDPQLLHSLTVASQYPRVPGVPLPSKPSSPDCPLRLRRPGVLGALAPSPCPPHTLHESAHCLHTCSWHSPPHPFPAGPELCSYTPVPRLSSMRYFRT